MKTHIIAFSVFVVFAIPPASGQVTIHPQRVAPASMERFALRVASGDEPTERVSVRLPTALYVLGVEKSDGWNFSFTEPSDEDSGVIEWSDGQLEAGEYREFAFFGRLAGDAKRKELIFPVTLTRTSGDRVEYNRTGGLAPPPTVMIVGSTTVSPWGAVGVAGVAVAIAIVALGLAVSRPRGQPQNV